MSKSKKKLFKTENDGMFQTSLNNYFQAAAKPYNNHVNEIKKNCAKVKWNESSNIKKIIKSVKKDSNCEPLNKLSPSKTLDVADENISFISTYTNIKPTKCKTNKYWEESYDENLDSNKLLTKNCDKSTLDRQDKDVAFVCTYIEEEQTVIEGNVDEETIILKACSNSKEKITRVRKVGSELPETSPNKKGKLISNDLDGTDGGNEMNQELHNASTSHINASLNDTIIYDATAIIENNFLQYNNFNEDLLQCNKIKCDVTLNESVGTRDEDGGLWSLRCFTKIVKFILSKSYLLNLFNDEDNRLLTNFLKMDKKYQQFCMKLYTYLPKWQNVHAFANKISLRISEAKAENMYEILKDNQCVITDYTNDDPISLLQNLKIEDIKFISKCFKLKPKGKKYEIIEKLLKNCKEQRTLKQNNSFDILKDRLKHVMGNCVKLSKELCSLFNRMHLLYSVAVDHMKISDLYFFMYNIENGFISLPVTCAQDCNIFKDQNEFMSYSESHECYTEFNLAMEKKRFDSMQGIARNVYETLKLLYSNCSKTNETGEVLRRFTAVYIYEKILSLASKHLTLKTSPLEIKDWLMLLIQHSFKKRVFYYDQLAMVESKYLKDHEQAAKVILEGLKNKDLPPIDINILSIRAESLIRSKKNQLSNDLKEEISNQLTTQPNHKTFKKIVINAQATEKKVSGSKRDYILHDGFTKEYCSVEDVALEHYKDSGYSNRIHCEGSLFTTLLFILFWDIIYDENVPGMFINEIQYLPLDFYSSQFYKKRKSAIDQRLNNIESGWSNELLEEFIKQTWHLHAYKKSLMSLLHFESQTFCDIVSCVERTKLKAILERMIKCFKMFHSGLPDLFMWNLDDSPKCKFVEVKGENDKLSIKQIHWLHFLKSISLEVEVCHVHTIGSKGAEKYNIEQTLPKDEDSVKEL